MNRAVEERDVAAQSEAQDLKFLVDESDRVTAVSDSVQSLLGWDAAQLVGRHVGDLFRIPADIPYSTLRQRFPQSDFRFAAYVRKSSGEDIYFEAMAKYAGPSRGVFLYQEKQTIPHALREELITKDGHFVRALALVQVGYWVWHIQADKIIWSEETYRLLGYEPSQVEAGMGHFMEAIHPDDRAYVQQNAGQVMQTGSAPDMEYRIVHKDGRIIFVKARAQLILDHDGNPHYLFGTLQDVTQQKEYENELKHAKNAAEQANLAKTQFLMRVNHEFRTPLNAVVGNAELLRLEVDEKCQEYLNDLLDGCQQLQDMVIDALDISAIDQIPMKFESVDVVKILRDLSISTQSLLKRFQVHFTLGETSVSSLFIQSDAKRLRQVIMNLVSNGIKYNRPGGSVKVDLRTEAGVAHIDITDTGVGIAPADYARIFQPFERVVSTENIIPGTGLGLALSRELAKVLGGSISFTSEQGVGSCFSLALPL